MPIQMQPVRSSNIAEVGYSPESEVLHVRFKSGALWEYTQITPEKFASFINAPSIGGYYAAFIKSTGTGRKMEDALPAKTDATLAADLAASVVGMRDAVRAVTGSIGEMGDAARRLDAEARRYVPPVLDDLDGPFAPTEGTPNGPAWRQHVERMNAAAPEDKPICPRCLGLAPLGCPECAGIGSVSR